MPLYLLWALGDYYHNPLATDRTFQAQVSENPEPDVFEARNGPFAISSSSVEAAVERLSELQSVRPGTTFAYIAVNRATTRLVAQDTPG